MLKSFSPLKKTKLQSARLLFELQSYKNGLNSIRDKGAVEEERNSFFFFFFLNTSVSKGNSAKPATKLSQKETLMLHLCG